jgi:hypothetical protein
MVSASRAPRLQALSTWDRIDGEGGHEIVARIDVIRRAAAPAELPYLERLRPA